MNFDWVEWFGYLASMVVLISLTMTSIIKLRWINLAGCILFAIFAYLINSIPTVFMNLGIACINLYFLYQIYYTKEEFKILSADTASEYFQHFIKIHKKSIEQQTPLSAIKDHSAYYVLRDNIIAGVLVGDVENTDELNIKLDFVIPQYRDFKLGKHYFSDHPDFFKNKGIKTLKAYTRNQDHKYYLEKVGFVQNATEEDLYTKSI